MSRAIPSPWMRNLVFSLVVLSWAVSRSPAARELIHSHGAIAMLLSLGVVALAAGDQVLRRQMAKPGPLLAWAASAVLVFGMFRDAISEKAVVVAPAAPSESSAPAVGRAGAGDGPAPLQDAAPVPNAPEKQVQTVAPAASGEPSRQRTSIPRKSAGVHAPSAVPSDPASIVSRLIINPSSQHQP